VEVDPDYQLPEAREDLAKVENWVHFNPHLLKAGRTAHYAPRHLGEDAAKELLAALEEKDAPADRLKAIADDARRLA
jgi:hypothetical protein